MNRPTATTCSAQRWSHRGSLRGHTSKTANAPVADRPRTLVRRKSANGELVHPCINRTPTAAEIVSATAPRRDVFVITPAGRAAAATSGMTLRIPAWGRPELRRFLFRRRRSVRLQPDAHGPPEGGRYV